MSGRAKNRANGPRLLFVVKVTSLVKVTSNGDFKTNPTNPTNPLIRQTPNLFGMTALQPRNSMQNLERNGWKLFELSCVKEMCTHIHTYTHTHIHTHIHTYTHIRTENARMITKPFSPKGNNNIKNYAALAIPFGSHSGGWKFPNWAPWLASEEQVKSKWKAQLRANEEQVKSKINKFWVLPRCARHLIFSHVVNLIS